MGTPENSWEGCWEECWGEIRGAGRSAGKGAARGGFPWKGMRSSTLAQHPEFPPSTLPSTLPSYFLPGLGGGQKVICMLFGVHFLRAAPLPSEIAPKCFQFQNVKWQRDACCLPSFARCRPRAKVASSSSHIHLASACPTQQGFTPAS